MAEGRSIDSLDPALNLGDGLSIEAMTTLVEEPRQAIETLNMTKRGKTSKPAQQPAESSPLVTLQ